MDEVFIPIIMILSIAGAVVMLGYYRFRARQELQVTLRESIQSGQSLSTEVVEELMRAMQPQGNDLRRGVVSVAISLAFLVLAFAIGGTVGDDASNPLFGLAAFPLFVGLAYIVLWRIHSK